MNPKLKPKLVEKESLDPEFKMQMSAIQMNSQNPTFKKHDESLDQQTSLMLKESYGKLCETEMNSNLKVS